MTASRASIRYTIAKQQRAHQLQKASLGGRSRVDDDESPRTYGYKVDKKRVTLPKLSFMESQNPAGGKIQATQGGVRAAAVMTGQSTVAAAPTNQGEEDHR